jgi:signal peptidase I
MVKRLIGLPGDVVQMQGGFSVLNGQPLAQEDAGVSRETYGPQGPSGFMPRCSNAVVGIGGICELQLRRETLPEGRSYLVANVEDGAHPDNMGPFSVPEGQIFFLGDHRDNSSDSRFAQGAGGLGFVPAENVVGRVTRIIFSASGSSLWAFWDWRGDRFFRAVE